MQNENAGKTVEQIAADMNPYRKDAHSYDPWEKGFETGYTTAQQSQPMCREIEVDRTYLNVAFRNKNRVGCMSGRGVILKSLGYTHYLQSEDLLRLPLAQSK